MKWDRKAEEALSRAPFFVRRRIRRRVEEEAREMGSKTVRLAHVRSCRRKYLRGMEDEVQGYRVETCFGSDGCPNRACEANGLAENLEDLLKQADLKEFLKQRVPGPLRFHHEFKVSISDCPNACSRPQIADLGLIGACRPEVDEDAECTGCGACLDVCDEGALSLTNEGIVLDADRCVSCGQCLAVCPTGALREGGRGYRVLLGGRLGRRPRLAGEAPGIFPVSRIPDVLEQCLSHYKSNNLKGERFGDVLERCQMAWPEPEAEAPDRKR